MAVKQLFTIGYEGAELSDFIATLEYLDIRQVIDVRELPLSRKRGFSKRSLEEALRQKGITYTHLKDLGDPKPGRDAARRGEMAEFRRLYRQHLRKVSSQDALVTAAKLAGSRRSCLLCFEREPVDCHRAIIAADLAASGNFKIVHIGISNTIGRHKSRSVQISDGHRSHAIG